jgi:hypothetical protein
MSLLLMVAAACGPFQAGIERDAPVQTPVLVLPERVSFATGSASATVTPDLSPGVPQAYVLKVAAGQHLLINSDHDLQLQVIGPDGRWQAAAAVETRQWDYTVRQAGDQTLVFNGAGHVSITIYVPPLATPVK